MSLEKYLPFTAWLVFAVLARTIPHLPNLSPYASLILLTGCQLNRRQAMMMTLLSLLASDIALAWLTHTAVFGSWTLFTYTGFIAIAAGSYFLHQGRTLTRVACYAIGSTMGYWLWTNFGTWALSGLYPHSTAGLSACMIAGLPFLQNSLFSALIFVPLFFGIFLLSPQKKPCKIQ